MKTLLMPSQVNIHPQSRNFIGKGRERYNQIQQNYNNNTPN